MQKKTKKTDPLFQDFLKKSNIKPLKQDQHFFITQNKKTHTPNEKKVLAEQTITLSDDYYPQLPDDAPMRYIKNPKNKYVLKQLRKGVIEPECFIDLHGLTKQEAKHELINGLEKAKKQKFECVCINHGLGQGILKEQVPYWLVQHPDVLAFHQSPLKFGGQGSLLVLLDIQTR